MITLKNIRQTDNILEADFFNPSLSESFSHIKYDVGNDEFIDIVFANGEKVYGYSHVKRELREMARLHKNGGYNYPEEYSIIWY